MIVNTSTPTNIIPNNTFSPNSPPNQVTMNSVYVLFNYMYVRECGEKATL